MADKPCTDALGNVINEGDLVVTMQGYSFREEPFGVNAIYRFQGLKKEYIIYSKFHNTMTSYLFLESRLLNLTAINEDSMSLALKGKDIFTLFKELTNARDCF